MDKPGLRDNEIADAFSELERGVHTALETYSNVHRGSGHNSMVSTHLFEQARDIILKYLGLSKGRYVVIFCTPARAAILMNQLKPGRYQIVSSNDIGLALGVKALVAKRKSLPAGVPFQTGGGTTKLISKGWVIWANAPDKFEAGTPAIINIIAFARALQLIRKYGKNPFPDPPPEKLTTTEILYNDELKEYSGKEMMVKLRQTIIGKSIRVPTLEGARPYTNLDNSASTPTFTPIWNTFRHTLRQPAQVQKEIIQEVRSICASMLGAPRNDFDLIFTSNTTEAINLAARSLSCDPDKGSEPVILNTFLEHSSNDLPWRMPHRNSLIRLSIDSEGFVDLKEMEKLLCAYNQESQYGKKRIKLVALSGASNVLGVCNNIEEISKIVHQYGAHLMVDGAQLIAHRKVNMEASGIDYLAFSAHKVYAPFGCGVLLARKGLLNFNPSELEPIQSSGEENTGGIAALGKAIVVLQRIGMEIIREDEQALTAYTLRRLSQIPGLTIYGIKDPDSPLFAHKLGVFVFELKGMMADRVAKKLAIQAGIGVRYGCHCAHILIKHLLNVSPGLERFQRLMLNLFPKLKLPGLTRVSLGIENSEEDIDTLIHFLDKIARKSRDKTDRLPTSDNSETLFLSKKDVKQNIEDFTRDAARRVYN